MFVIGALGARWVLDVRGMEPGTGEEPPPLWARARVDHAGCPAQVG